MATNWKRPSLFFLLTVASTLWVGGLSGLSFWGAAELQPASELERIRLIMLYGAPFSFTILAIIFSHEMGHYWTARHYQIDTTLPYFIPFPFSMIGTFGAFILIRSRFPHRRSLIDVGLAGPFAGFLVTLPALLVGIWTSHPGPATSPETSISFGEPLLFQWLAKAIWPNLPDDYVLWVSPIGLAAWFGLLLTALNLLPIGQLDGGHATYALFRKGAHRLSRLVFLAFLPMAYFGPSWLIWAFLLYALGIRRPHPETMTDELPLPRSRVFMGVAALVVFVLCFTPEPIVFDWREMFGALKELFG